MSTENVYRIPPFQYIHVLDNNTNITRLECGPATYIRREHEAVVAGPSNMIKLPPRHYCIISNPVVMGSQGEPELTSFGQIKSRFGDDEVRTSEKYTEPFPLYPGETVKGSIEKYQIVNQNQGLKLSATRDFKDEKGIARNAGDEWLVVGPFTYVPRIEESILAIVSAEVIKANKALKLRARKNCKDSAGVSRKTGEEWLIRETGSYLPQIDEINVGQVQGIILTDTKACRLRAIKDYKDFYGIERRAGEEWLIKADTTQVHIPDVYEEVVGEVAATILSNRQFCVILDPYCEKARTNKLGSRALKEGPATFFLQPGESLEGGAVQDVKVLSEDEALLLQAIEDTVDSENNKRKAGERWLIQGPREYVPPVQVKILNQRKKIPLDENEGIYVRNCQTGSVEVITGKTYLLGAFEELWEKELPDIVEELIAKQKAGQAYVAPKMDEKGNLVYEKFDMKGYKRDKTKVVTFKAPHNSAVQLYDYKAKKSRVAFGPSLVMLAPDEQFTLINLSGGIPKKEGQIKGLTLHLGPDFMHDLVDVETSDHARLRIQLSYNWSFRFDKNSERDCEKIFSVKDFVGDACKSVASRIRGAVSSVSFDDFHKKRKNLIQVAVFGAVDGVPKNELIFENNCLVITGVDVQNPEPIDSKMRDSLFKAQTLNIDITTRTQEMNARHEALRQEQESKGQLEVQKYNDLSQAEEARKELLLLQAETEAIQSKGKAVAEAKAKAEALIIEIEAEVEQAKLRAEALKIESDADNETLKQQHDAEVKYQEALNNLEINKAKKMADIESTKFKTLVSSIGKETIIAMARAGPDTQLKLLQGLGLKGFLISDGKNPINLFNTANGILGGLNTKA